MLGGNGTRGKENTLARVGCGMSYVKHVFCLSNNVAAFRDREEQKTLCEPLPSDKYSKSNRFSSSQQYNHFSIMVSKVNHRF